MVRVHVGEIDFEGVPDLSTFEWFSMTANAIQVQVSQPVPSPNWGDPLAPTNGSLGGPSPRANCNSGTQVSQINTAGSNAITAAQQGLRYLPSGNCQAKDGYVTWFGACDNNRYTKVRNTLNAVIGGLQANYPVDCAGSSCTSNTYAYVFPSDNTHTVYVCGLNLAL